jgi:glycogen(starch) synthase
MRIVLLPSAFAPRVGGVEIFTDRLARGLRNAGHDVEIWTARDPNDDLAERESIDGLRVRRFVFAAPRVRPAAAAVWPGRALRTFKKMKAALREFKPDVLHVHCFSGNGVYATLLSAISGTPLVVTLHGETFMDDYDIYDRSLYLRAGLRVGLRRASWVTACSQFALDDAIVRFGAVPGRSTVIFNGVDTDVAKGSDWAAPSDRFVLAVGRVVHRKGFDLLLQAWTTVAKSHPNTSLVIGGSGPEVPRLLKIVESLSLEGRVLFCGPMSRADVAQAMQQAEVFVMPSRVEAFGIVALEAWRAGTPAVVTANGGAAEFVEDGVNGLVVDPFDAGALSGAIDRLLVDAGLRKSLVGAATAGLGQFVWPYITKRYEIVYEEILRSR